MGQHPEFLACLCYIRSTEYLLTLSCFPVQFKSQVDNDIAKYSVYFQGEGTSERPLCAEDRAFVSLSEAFSVKQKGHTEDFYLK